MVKLFISALLGTLFVIGCSSADKKAASTAEEAFKKAQEYEKDENYIEAIERYSEVKNKFPYSKLATESELAVADIHFKEEDYPEAQASYLMFKELHPKHPKIAYVTHRLGLSYFNQLPDTIDRDLSIADEAIDTFNEVIDKYPSSDYVKEAREKKNDCLKRLAEKEMYIAHFYFIRSRWAPAFKRYSGVLSQHKNLGFDEVALARSYIAVKNLGKTDEASKLLQEFKTRYPNSSEIPNSEMEIK